MRWLTSQTDWLSVPARFSGASPAGNKRELLMFCYCTEVQLGTNSPLHSPTKSPDPLSIHILAILSPPSRSARSLPRAWQVLLNLDLFISSQDHSTQLGGQAYQHRSSLPASWSSRSLASQTLTSTWEPLVKALASIRPRIAT